MRIEEPIVKYEFIRMPDSTGFGDYTEGGQVIPVSFRGRKRGHTHRDYGPVRVATAQYFVLLLC